MEMRKIGSLDVSLLGLGCNNFGMRIQHEASREVINQAVDSGVNYFDTANMYSAGVSEEILGSVLANNDSVVIGTKFGHAGSLAEGEVGGHPDVIARSIDQSLTRLGVDCIGHYMIHKPDTETPIAETLGALQGLIDAGKVKELGCCNFSAAQLTEAADAAEANGLTAFATVQNHYSVLTRTPETDGVLEVCAQRGIGFVPYFPLESGLLTGKYRKGADLPEGSRLDAWKDLPHGAIFLSDKAMDGADKLMTYAEGTGHTVLELAMSWLAAQPAVVSIISGATKPQQVVGNAAALGWAMTAAELAAVDALLG